MHTDSSLLTHFDSDLVAKVLKFAAGVIDAYTVPNACVVFSLCTRKVGRKCSRRLVDGEGRNKRQTHHRLATGTSLVRKPRPIYNDVRALLVKLFFSRFDVLSLYAPERWQSDRWMSDSVV